MGIVEICQIFCFLKVGMIVGCMIIDGIICCYVKVCLVCDGVVVQEIEINMLQCEKDVVIEVCEGYECGLILINYFDIYVGDEVQCYEMVEKFCD